MAYKINNTCSRCGDCETVCPNQAISSEDYTFRIKTAKCTECVGSKDGPVCVSVCMMGACVHDTK